MQHKVFGAVYKTAKSFDFELKKNQIVFLTNTSITKDNIRRALKDLGVKGNIKISTQINKNKIKTRGGIKTVKKGFVSKFNKKRVTVLLDKKDLANMANRFQYPVIMEEINDLKKEIDPRMNSIKKEEDN